MKKKLISLLVIAFVLAACGKNAKSSSFTASTTSSNETVTSSSSDSFQSQFIEYTSSGPREEITNVQVVSQGHYSQYQTNYLNSENYSDTAPYNGNLSVSKPLPINITWDSNVEGPYTVRISGPRGILEYSTNEKHFEFYNAEFNVPYNVQIRKDNVLSTHVTFQEEITVSGPRSLFVEGVENIRDIGGWGKFDNGVYKTFIKQGMLYRSGRFNEDKADPVNVTITNNGLYEMNNHFKIKTEIDLRRITTNEVGSLTDESPLGDNVNYIQIPMAYGGNNILTFNGKLNNDTAQYDNPAAIKQFFELLADENNYPIDFHCSIGKDRTGCMAYLIEGLLGFDQETMYRDYMFTNYADAGMCKIADITDRYGNTIDKYEKGDTLQEKVYYYLNEVIGVSLTDLKKIIDILKAS